MKITRRNWKKYALAAFIAVLIILLYSFNKMTSTLSSQINEIEYKVGFFSFT
jgi:hypothetical protein